MAVGVGVGILTVALVPAGMVTLRVKVPEAMDQSLTALPYAAPSATHGPRQTRVSDRRRNEGSLESRYTRANGSREVQPRLHAMTVHLWCIDGLASRLGTMAVLLLSHISPATQEEFNLLDARVGQSMASAGGPPTGLMSHLVYPEGDGLVVADVWRSEAEGRAYIDDVLRPLVAGVGLTSMETSVRAVWSFARP